MPFYPENRPPRVGLPVYDGNGDQLNLSDPRFRYQDDLPNTSKVFDASTDNYYGTTGAALARASQLGCDGFHVQLASDGVYYYRPCLSDEWLTERLEQLNSALNFTYIGNYRVLTWDAPFRYVSSFNGWIIDIAGAVSLDPILLDDDSSARIPNDIAIDFRYSVDGKTWSLWTNVGTALTGISKSFTSNNKAENFLIQLNPENPFYPEFRFTSVIVNQDGSIAFEANEPIDPSVVIVDFDLDLTFSTGPDGPDGPGGPGNPIIPNPVPQCSPEKSNRPVVFDNCNFTFDPYAINKGINLYKDLSLIVNKIFGFEVNYYSVQPQSRSKDIILKEWTLFDVVDEKCIKVMVPSNQFPDNKVNYDPFGINFEEPFEIHIDKTYFETFFGRGSQPRKRDIIYFPLTNRIYEINSTYLFRDFMYSPVYFKIELKKYNPKSNTYFTDPALKEELDGISLNTQKLFGGETVDEEKKLTKPQQYVTSSQRKEEDPNRSYVYQNLPIVGYDLNNNWTIVFNNYYDLNEAFVTDSNFVYEPQKYRTAVRYKNIPVLLENDEFSYTAWFSLKNYVNENSLSKKPFSPAPITQVTTTNEAIVYNSHPFKHGLVPFKSYFENPEGYVAIQADVNHTGGFKVKSVIDQFNFSVANPGTPFSQGPVNLKMQKAQSRNFLDGTFTQNGQTKGIRIDMIHSGVSETGNNNFIEKGSIEVVINGVVYNESLQFVPRYGDWYALVVNVSNKYKQIGVNFWGMSYDPNNPQQQTSDLIKVHESFWSLSQPHIFAATPDVVTNPQNPLYGTDNNAYKIYTSPLLLSNVRIFKEMIDIDRQSIVLNQNIVRDAQFAYVIDNAQPNLVLPKFARNR